MANDPKVAYPSDDIVAATHPGTKFTEVVEPSADQAVEISLLETDEPLESLQSFLETTKRLLHKTHSEEVENDSGILAQPTDIDSDPTKQPKRSVIGV